MLNYVLHSLWSAFKFRAPAWSLSGLREWFDERRKWLRAKFNPRQKQAANSKSKESSKAATTSKNLATVFPELLLDGLQLEPKERLLKSVTDILSNEVCHAITLIVTPHSRQYLFPHKMFASIHWSICLLSFRQLSTRTLFDEDISDPNFWPGLINSLILKVISVSLEKWLTQEHQIDWTQFSPSKSELKHFCHSWTS